MSGKSIKERLAAAVETNAQAHHQASASASVNRVLQQIPVASIRRNENQPRRVFNQESLDSLALSIREHGLWEPITVRPAKDGQGYELIQGERRWRAHQQNGAETIEAVIQHCEDVKSAIAALLENIAREGLYDYEIYLGLHNIEDSFDMTHTKLAESIGMSRSAYYRILDFKKLPGDILALLNEKPALLSAAAADLLVPTIPDGEGTTMLRYEWTQQCLALLEVYEMGGMTIQQVVEQLRAEFASKNTKDPSKKTNEGSEVILVQNVQVATLKSSKKNHVLKFDRDKLDEEKMQRLMTFLGELFKQD